MTSQISKGNYSKNVDKTYGSCSVMMLYTSMKFHENNLNGFHTK